MDLPVQQLDSFLDVLIVGGLFLVFVVFFERRKAEKKDRAPFFGRWRLFYAAAMLVAFAFFHAVGFNLGWIVLWLYLGKCMWDDYKYDRQTHRWNKERKLEAQQMRNS
jgi:hypothetical protein